MKIILLITEYPPYVKPERWTFPMRNRIISGLSDAVVVTEAADKSGTMSTVEHALDHGKDIYAVPGPVTSCLSAGPNKLIDEGAQPLWNGFQIVGSLVLTNLNKTNIHLKSLLLFEIWYTFCNRYSFEE